MINITISAAGQFTGYGCSHLVKLCQGTTKQCQTQIACFATNYCMSYANFGSVGDRDGDDADCLHSVPKFTIDPNSGFDKGCTSDEKV